jgi:TonB family protein
MSAGAQVRGWNGPSRRRVPRYQVQAQLDVTVLRSGIPDTLPGRSLNLCERGVAAVLAGELVPGEAVGIELRLPLAQDPVRTRATVRYQDNLRCGLEFVGISIEQRTAIRDWAKDSKADSDVNVSLAPAVENMEKVERLDKIRKAEKREKAETTEKVGKKSDDSGGGSSGGLPPDKSGKGRRGIAWTIFLLTAAVAVAVFWWKWNRAWDELESGLKTQQTVAPEKPQAQVPAEVMEKLLVHKVEPAYPAEARKANLQGIIALDVVIGRDGSVMITRPLNGPDVLARAAMDALRWWKFEPYRVNGEPAVVETTVAVEFKK